MLNPDERRLAHICILAILVMMAYTSYFFGLPWFCSSYGLICDYIPASVIPSSDT
eukprot:m.91576 g.91576  ORF g.91576 m.91576 type:complete len:55 (+) comp16498_c0_seq3:833-997(+)